MASMAPTRGWRHRLVAAALVSFAAWASMHRESVSFAQVSGRRQTMALWVAAPAPAWAGDVFAQKRLQKAKEIAEQKYDASGRLMVEVARPTGKKKKLYTYDLPIPKGQIWGDYSKQDDPAQPGALFKGQFGNKTENQVVPTQVFSGKQDPEFAQSGSPEC
ncbi:unnamed protein product, partial [Effrenium voratum]